MGSYLADGVPAHVRYFDARLFGKAGNRATEKAKAIHAAVFFAAGHHELRANADTKEGFFPRGLPERFFDVLRADVGHATANRALARQQDTIGTGNIGGSFGKIGTGIGGGMVECFADAVQIAHAVVDDGDVHVDLAEGWWKRCLLLATARRKRRFTRLFPVGQGVRGAHGCIRRRSRRGFAGERRR